MECQADYIRFNVEWGASGKIFKVSITLSNGIDDGTDRN
jgi:hypothetical protein